MPSLGVVITSTRPNRIGLAIGRWFAAKAEQHGRFAVQTVDLKEVALPPLDEPEHPRLQNYQHEHTRAWSRTVAALDAFVFVVPEYNFALPPALVNALDYLFAEWHYKACGFVSYGGASGGTRSVQMCKQIVTSLKMMPIPEAVAVPFVAKLIGPSGAFDPGTTQDEAVTRMLDELARWTGALAGLRQPSRAR